MLSVEEALDRILARFDVLSSETVGILDSLGQVLSEDIFSSINVPPVDNSAMDGYALKSKDTAGSSKQNPVILKVCGSVSAGESFTNSIASGQAVRIMTGAPIPDGANAVIPFEETDEESRLQSNSFTDEIGVLTQVEAGSDVRPAGQDIKNGQLVLKSGKELRPAEIGVLASLGLSEISVTRKPKVAILSTGNELIKPGSEITPNKIYDSNSYSVSSAALKCGAITKILEIGKDNFDSLTSILDSIDDFDFLITSAGVSKGDYDIVKDVLKNHGQIDFWSVRMRPAKPLAFGTFVTQKGKSIPHLGLPGNPVSALVAFEQFGRPSIRKMMGKSFKRRPSIRAVLEDPIYNGDGRRVFARVIVTKKDQHYKAKLTGHQNSNLLTSMAYANGLAICPENEKIKKAGETVEVQMIDWPEETTL